jgi:hypothetical protein
MQCSAAQLLSQRLARSTRTVVKDKGVRLPQPEVAAQGTSTGPTATCGVSVDSSSCVTSLLTSCQVCKDGGKKQGRPNTPTRSAAQRTRTGPTATCGVSSSCAISFFNVLPESMGGRGRGNGGVSSDDNNERYQQHPQRRRLPMVNGHLLGQTLAIAKTQ